MTNNIKEYLTPDLAHNHTSADFIGTTNFRSDLVEIRSAIKETNKLLRRANVQTISVRIKGRLGNDNINAHKYAGKRGAYIRLDDAERYDVYLITNHFEC